MKKKHPEHVNHERWLVSYADFITLLFAFFVVLFASGQSDKRKEIMLAHAMQSAFRYNGIFDPHSRTPPISTDSGGSVEAATIEPLALPVPTDLGKIGPGPGAGSSEDSMGGSIESSTRQIREVIRNQVAEHKAPAGAISVRTSPDGLVVTLREGGFFASGSADLRDETASALRSLIAALPRQPMRIEGHTDDVPIHTAQFATNWELSTARAANITRLLIAQGAADPTHISAAGYAEFHPIASNETEQGRGQNRRVDIVLLTPPPPAPSQSPASPADRQTPHKTPAATSPGPASRVSPAM